MKKYFEQSTDLRTTVYAAVESFQYDDASDIEAGRFSAKEELETSPKGEVYPVLYITLPDGRQEWVKHSYRQV